jgi:hypothetical protein
MYDGNVMSNAVWQYASGSEQGCRPTPSRACCPAHMPGHVASWLPADRPNHRYTWSLDGIMMPASCLLNAPGQQGTTGETERYQGQTSCIHDYVIKHKQGSIGWDTGRKLPTGRRSSEER